MPFEPASRSCRPSFCEAAVTGRIVDLAHGHAASAQIVQLTRDIREITAHLEFHRWLTGGAQKIPAMESGLGNRGIEGFRGVVRAVVSVGEAGSLRCQVRERRHHHRGVRAAHPIRHRYQREFADFIADARIRHRFELVERLPVGRIRHTLEQMNRGEAARDDALAGREPYRAHGVKWWPSVAPASAALIHVLRRDTVARCTGRRPGRTTFVRALSDRQIAAPG